MALGHPGVRRLTTHSSTNATTSACPATSLIPEDHRERRLVHYSTRSSGVILSSGTVLPWMTTRVQDTALNAFVCNRRSGLGPLKSVCTWGRSIAKGEVPAMLTTTTCFCCHNSSICSSTATITAIVRRLFRHGLDFAWIIDQMFLPRRRVRLVHVYGSGRPQTAALVLGVRWIL